MTNPVNNTPALNRPKASREVIDLVQSLFRELSDHARAINAVVAGPLPVRPYLKAELPAAADFIDHIAAVIDEAGGYTIAFSDGTNWRRVQDRVIVS